MLIPLPTPQTRQWIYNICLAAVPLLITYGVIHKEDAALWIGLAAAFFGQGIGALALSQQRRAGVDLELPTQPPTEPVQSPGPVAPVEAVDVEVPDTGRHAKRDESDDRDSGTENCGP